MNIEKLKYCKCPNCEKHGIPAFKKIGGSWTYEVSCKYCQKTYRVDWGAARVGNFMIMIILFIIIMVTGMPAWLSVVLIAAALGLFEYFAPMDEVVPAEKDNEKATESDDAKRIIIKDWVKNLIYIAVLCIIVLTMVYFCFISPYRLWDASLEATDNDRKGILESFWKAAFFYKRDFSNLYKGV